ncbi:zinc-binding alcohol dehydrogenase [Corynebacterium sp. HMSC11D10]|uniref:DUF2871 domain-containing protein n=1 Tax=Corynebacterium sp. HMSC11D10 TaxID=1581088 RepID=UPI0008A39761|nr:DUF2871 domain-containing protein [Corynebacterium sp. HMSC11D10]OFU55133.1 zinc-binding alcohol dehydrogenase [Corynebacterium sp. HMSC11D10]
MKALYRAAIFYLALGLISGVFYREFTRANNFPEGQFTQLSVTHTHLLALGFMMFLIFLALEKVFTFSRNKKLFNIFFWLYNAGLLTTVSMLILHGSMTVLGKESGAAISGIAGLGHIMLTIALVIFVVLLGRAIDSPTRTSEAASAN